MCFLKMANVHMHVIRNGQFMQGDLSVLEKLFISFQCTVESTCLIASHK